MWDLVKNPENRFSHNEAHLSLVSRKTIFEAYDTIRIKTSLCSPTDHYHKLKILDIEKRGIKLLRSLSPIGRIKIPNVRRIWTCADNAIEIANNKGAAQPVRK